MSNRIIITGATGLIGKNIVKKLIDRKDEVIIFSRSPQKAAQVVPGAIEYVQWNPRNINTWANYLNNSDAVINLAGENLMAKRWNEKHKKNIIGSRVVGTRSLVNAIANSQHKPEVIISASAVGYYGTSETEKFYEDSPPGNDFLSKVTTAWERESADVESLGVRRVIIRIGIVLDAKEGALAKMLTPFKFFVGGPPGSGKQWFPWIHIDDVTDIFLFALDNKNVGGALNAVSPNPLRMKEFCKKLGRVMNRPSIFPVPVFVLKILLGEGADAVTKGAKVLPKRTVECGYKFKFEKADDALSHLLSQKI